MLELFFKTLFLVRTRGNCKNDRKREKCFLFNDSLSCRTLPRHLILHEHIDAVTGHSLRVTRCVAQ